MKKIRVKEVVFEKVPVSDSTWAITMGSDSKVYAACCCEHTGE